MPTLQGAFKSYKQHTYFCLVISVTLSPGPRLSRIKLSDQFLGITIIYRCNEFYIHHNDLQEHASIHQLI
jgi:hypothetical protein